MEVSSKLVGGCPLQSSWGSGNWYHPPVFCPSWNVVHGSDLLKDTGITYTDHPRYPEALMPIGPLDTHCCVVCMVFGHRAQVGLPSSGQDITPVASCSPAALDLKLWAPEPSLRAQSRTQDGSERTSAELLATVQSC